MTLDDWEHSGTCAKNHSEPNEPLMTTTSPCRSQERLAATLFEPVVKVYVFKLLFKMAGDKAETEWSIPERVNPKELFSTHSIPSIIVSDKGPQFSSEPFLLSFSEYDVVLVTILPKYLTANGEVEGQTAQSKQCSSVMKTCIQPSLLTDLHFFRMVFHSTTYS